MVATWWLLAGAAGGATVPVMPITRRLGALISAAAVAATALVVAPPASAAPGDDAAVVNAWYTDFLDRPAYGDVGAQGWLDRLGVQAPGDVLWSLAHTREYNAARLRADYLFYLGREPDAGSRYWLEGATAQAFPLEWAEQNILASPEYARSYGADIVYGWYYNVLGIEALPGEDRPTSGEVAYWNGRIRAVGRLGALRELWYSPEAVTGRIYGAYYFELDRDPSPGEIAYWAPREVESEINVRVLIGASPEYRSLAR